MTEKFRGNSEEQPYQATPETPIRPEVLVTSSFVRLRVADLYTNPDSDLFIGMIAEKFGCRLVHYNDVILRPSEPQPKSLKKTEDGNLSTKTDNIDYSLRIGARTKKLELILQSLKNAGLNTSAIEIHYGAVLDSQRRKTSYLGIVVDQLDLTIFIHRDEASFICYGVNSSNIVDSLRKTKDELDKELAGNCLKVCTNYADLNTSWIQSIENRIFLDSPQKQVISDYFKENHPNPVDLFKSPLQDIREFRLPTGQGFLAVCTVYFGAKHALRPFHSRTDLAVILSEIYAPAKYPELESMVSGLNFFRDEVQKVAPTFQAFMDSDIKHIAGLTLEEVAFKVFSKEDKQAILSTSTYSNPTDFRFIPRKNLFHKIILGSYLYPSQFQKPLPEFTSQDLIPLIRTYYPTKESLIGAGRDATIFRRKLFSIATLLTGDGELGKNIFIKANYQKFLDLVYNQ